MKTRILKLGLAALLALGVPAAVLAHGAADASKGLSIAATKAQANVPTSVDSGKPEGVGQGEENNQPENQPEDTGRPTDNHGWFVSQVATDHSTTGRAHGDAVKAVAMSDQGKPSAATSNH